MTREVETGAKASAGTERREMAKDRKSRGGKQREDAGLSGATGPPGGLSQLSQLSI